MRSTSAVTASTERGRFVSHRCPTLRFRPSTKRYLVGETTGMELRGHLGTALILSAESLVLLGPVYGTVATVVMLALTPVPDWDRYISKRIVKHRGPTHSLVFALVTSFVLASAVASPGTARTADCRGLQRTLGRHRVTVSNVALPVLYRYWVTRRPPADRYINLRWRIQDRILLAARFLNAGVRALSLRRRGVERGTTGQRHDGVPRCRSTQTVLFSACKKPRHPVMSSACRRDCNPAPGQ